MDNFSKLYLLSPESYNKLVLDKMIRQGLDREMYNILAMKKITDGEKWYLYRQQLIKFANKSRHNNFGNTEENNNKKTKTNFFDAATSTDRIHSPIINKGIQADVETSDSTTQTARIPIPIHDKGIQTSPIMDETNFSYSPNTDGFDSRLNSTLEEEEEEFLWSPTARNKPKTPKKKLNFEEERRKSVNDSIISTTLGGASSAARKLLNQSVQPPLRRASTIPGPQHLTQGSLNFPVVKHPRTTRATSKAMGQQTGGRCFKWICMK